MVSFSLRYRSTISTTSVDVGITVQVRWEGGRGEGGGGRGEGRGGGTGGGRRRGERGSREEGRGERRVNFHTRKWKVPVYQLHIPTCTATCVTAISREIVSLSIQEKSLIRINMQRRHSY